MQKLLETGKAKNIGVSNFQIRHLEKLLSDPSCKVVPAVNQLEVSHLPGNDMGTPDDLTDLSTLVAPLQPFVRLFRPHF